MFTAIAAWFKSLFGATEAVAGEVKQRDAEENTTDMQANAEAAQIQALKDKAAKDISNPDQTNLGKDVSP